MFSRFISMFHIYGSPFLSVKEKNSSKHVLDYMKNKNSIVSHDYEIKRQNYVIKVKIMG